MNQDTIQLIQFVEEYPCLYNSSIIEYSRKDLTEGAWSDISKKMQLSVGDCKNKWKNVRNGFVRSLKAQYASVSKDKRPYYLQDALRFLLPYVKPMKHYANNNDEESEGGDLTNVFMQEHEFTEITEQEDPMQTTSKEEAPEVIVNNKRKIECVDITDRYVDDNICPKNPIKQENYKKMFMLSLMPDVEKLTDSNLRKFKIQVLESLQNLLYNQKARHNVNSSLKSSKSYDANSPSPVVSPGGSNSASEDPLSLN